MALPSFLRLPERAVRPERALPVNAWSLRSVYTRSLGMIVVPACWWTLVIAGFAAWMVVVVKQIETQMASLYASSPLLKDVITRVGGGDISTNATLLSFLFVFLPLLLMAFAATQANRWSADEEDGRLELVLSTPQPRLRVLLGRFAALTTATIIIGMLTLAATARLLLADSAGESRLAGDTEDGHRPAIPVTSLTIDEVCRREGVAPDFIKIDVEGSELAVLRGARETIRARRGRLAVFVELHPTIWPRLGVSRDDVLGELRALSLAPESLKPVADLWAIDGLCVRLREI